MAPTPLWSGSIAFGRWEVAVRLYAAVEATGSRAHLVDRRDLAPAGEEVPAEEVVRALEIEQGRFVPLEPGDLDRLDVELASAIELNDFVRPAEIDPVHLRDAYYLVPAEGAERAYRVLSRALEETGRVARATVAIRSTLHPACLRSADGVLVLQTMYADGEVVRPAWPPL